MEGRRGREPWEEGRSRAGAWVFYEVKSVVRCKTTHQSSFQRTRHAVVVNDPIWQGGPEPLRVHAGDKIRQICKLSKAQFRMALGGVGVLPHHSDTRPRARGVLCHVIMCS